MSAADGGSALPGAPAHGMADRAASNQFVVGLVVLVALLIGANFSVMQLALEHTTPILLTGMRTAVGGLALLAYTRLRGERIPTDRRTLLGIFVVSVCITTISSMSLVVGVSLVPAGVAALLSSLVPVWTALLAFSFLSERLNRLAVAGIVTGLIGAVVLSSPALEGETSLVGVLILVVSGVSWAAGIVVTRWWNFGDVSSVMITTVQLFMSTMVVVPIGLVVEGTADTDVGLPLILPLLYAAIPSMAVTFALLAVVTRNASATQASATAYLTPVFGVLFAWLIRDNTLSLPEWIGGALLVIGVVLVTTGRAR
ncbi:MAG: EamA family transporter [Actinomycetota bacterium]